MLFISLPLKNPIYCGPVSKSTNMWVYIHIGVRKQFAQALKPHFLGSCPYSRITSCADLEELNYLLSAPSLPIDSGGVGGLVTKLCPSLAAPLTVALQTPPSMGLSRKEYWSGFPFPSPGGLPDPEI